VGSRSNVQAHKTAIQSHSNEQAYEAATYHTAAAQHPTPRGTDERSEKQADTAGGGRTLERRSRQRNDAHNGGETRCSEARQSEVPSQRKDSHHKSDNHGSRKALTMTDKLVR
jgi:hypothetical protein